MEATKTAEEYTEHPQRDQDLFPRGLYQPPGSFRFSADALLLSAFFLDILRKLDAKGFRPHGPRLLDIGTGCGAIALSLLRSCSNVTVMGVDVQPELTAAARRNAETLGFSGRFTVLDVDISRRSATGGMPHATMLHAVEASGVGENSCEVPGAAISGLEVIPRESFDLVLANPPYRKANQGRKPATVARTLALFEKEAELDDFCRTATWALKSKARFGVIFPAARLADLVLSLHEAGLGLRRLLPVHSRKEEAAKFVLVEARKDSRHDLCLEPPLVLYEGRGEKTRLTDAALAFCPDLGVNPRGRS